MRLSIQGQLDAKKSQAERNKCGQFATPTKLAHDIAETAVSLLPDGSPVEFFDPAIGTGAFFSALLDSVSSEAIKRAVGFELDPHYAEPAKELWKDTLLDLRIGDFTQASVPEDEGDRFNLVVCNPPYVRHHHMANREKVRLQDRTESACGVRIAGLAGLYCYFLGLAHPWMKRDGIGAWLIPSEFMDVNYGKAVKRYLLDRVSLIRIHRADPSDVQFDDALVSSAVVFFRRRPPETDSGVEFTYGGTLAAPKIARTVRVEALRHEPKWTRFPVSGVRRHAPKYKLSDLFTIKRGLATGDNKFFILTEDQIVSQGLPWRAFRPILPSPRFVFEEEIHADQDGLPVLDRKLFLLDCREPEAQVQREHPRLWRYLEGGKGTVSERYLCRNRRIWYSQEQREPAPLLCTYMGRANTKNGRPFRFILNHSKATAANVYLLLYPRPHLARAAEQDASLLHRLWQALNALHLESVIGEGRLYGGGLHKLEPKELGNVDVGSLIESIPGLPLRKRHVQRSLF